LSNLLYNSLAKQRCSAPLRWLRIIVGITATLLVCRFATQEDLSWLWWAIPGVAVIFVAVIRWPYGALLILIGTSAMSRFSVNVFGWNARPEHFAIAIISLGVGGWLLLSRGRIRWETIDYCILSYVAANYLSSAFTSPAPSETLRWALLNNLAVLPYFLIRVLVRDPETLRKAFRILLLVSVTEAAYGILCYVSNHVFGTKTGMEVGAYLEDVAAPFGSLYEPNFFGAYGACCAVSFIALYLFGGRHRLRYLMGFAVASVATILSFSRMAVFALVLAMAWVFWQVGRAGESRSNKLAFSTLGLILVLSATAVGAVTRERFTDLFQQGLTEETTITRIIVDEEALQEIPKHPLLGSGTGSFNLTFDWSRYTPDWAGNTAWIGNAPLRILHDTGLLGLITILGFSIAVWKKIRQVLRDRGRQPPVLLALCAGALVYCISFQTSDATTLAFPWVQIGLLASAATLGEQSQLATTIGSAV
jgi:O-antigen ligase